jgi:alginate O-acetyltransferase complex protein AlgI
MTWTAEGSFYWMALFVSAAWLPPRNARPYALIIFGILVLGMVSPKSLLVMLGLGTFGYGAAHLRKLPSRWAITTISICAVGCIIFNKANIHIGSETTGSMLLLGLSFYALRIIHYVIETRTASLKRHTLTDYAVYVTFYPILIAGPVHRFEEFRRDLYRRRWDRALCAGGLERILYGFVKITVMGNYFVNSKLDHWIAGIDPSSWAGAYLRCFSFGANMYFQFSGYSDIAIGLAMIAGFRLIENFRFPFLAVNIQDFWRRWHISAANWFRDYVFTPTLAVSRHPIPAILLSMLLLGIWHELSIRYLAWGLYHGFGIAVLRLFRYAKSAVPLLPPGLQVRKSATLLSWLITLNFVIVGFAFTCTNTLQESFVLLKTLFLL